MAPPMERTERAHRHRLTSDRANFAFETTLSGLTYLRRMEAWKRAGYRTEIAYLRLDSVDLALRRIVARVLQGGHDVARRDVVRRFKRGWANFEKCLSAYIGFVGRV